MSCAWALLFFAIHAGDQESRNIDTKQSTITVHAYKSGLFSFAGHDHLISAPISEGKVNRQQGSVEFTIHAADMRVLDPGETEKNRTEIRTTMLGEKLLDIEKFPLISFRATSVDQTDPVKPLVKGLLTLHGITGKVSVVIKKDGDRYFGTTKLKQSDYGMKPVSVAGGNRKGKR